MKDNYWRGDSGAVDNNDVVVLADIVAVVAVVVAPEFFVFVAGKIDRWKF